MDTKLQKKKIKRLFVDAKIRDLREEELDDLIKLCKKHAKYENSELTLKKQDLKEAIFDKNIVKCKVAVFNNKIIAYTTYIKQFSTWDAKFYLYMDCLYVRKKFRGKGLGKTFIQELKEEAKKLNCDLIQWQTPISNKKAVTFYKKMKASSKEKIRFFLKP